MNLNPSPNGSSQPPVKKSGSSTLVIIIVIIVGAILLLSVGGFLAWKYYFKAKFSKTATPTATTSETKTGTKVSLKKIEGILVYPNGTITSTDRSGDYGAASRIDTESADSLTVVYNYYLNLAPKNDLTVSKKSIESDNSFAAVTLQGTDYYADINIYQYEKSEFEISIYGENITNDTATTSTTTGTTATTGSTSTTKSSTTTSSSYIISDSNTRVIAESELVNLTPWQLKVARNEIYARHGREFVHKDLQCYFATQSWYKADPSFNESVLNTIETKNIAMISNYEEITSSPLQSTDSGCKN